MRHGARIGPALALLAWLAAPAGAQPGGGPAAGDAGPAAGVPRTIPAPVEEAEPPRVSASVSGKDIVLGGTFSLFVRAVYQPGVTVNLPAVLPLGGAFEEAARTDSTRVNPDGTITRDFELAILAFEVGELVIPPIPVTYAAHGRARDVMTEPVAIEVKSFLGEGEAALRDISGPVAVERRDLTLIYVAGGALAAIALIAALVIARRRWRRRQREVLARLPEAVQRSAHDEALSRLDALEATGALDSDDLKPAYLQMSEILRLYIGRRFGFPALDLTTVEIRRELEARPAGPPAAEMVTGWLELADLVKFAGYPASADEAREALYDARRFIDRTRAGAEAGGPGAPGGTETAAPPPFHAGEAP